MNTIQKIIIGSLSAVVLAVAGYFIADNLLDSQQKKSDTPEKIVADYQDLQAEAERLQMFVDPDCKNRKDVNDRIKEMEKKLADLVERKKQWLDNVPQLPEVEPEILTAENQPGRPGSEVPTLDSDVPPLPDIDPIMEPGSEVPELTSDVPPLPDLDIQVVDDSGKPVEYIPEMPEINTGRPGSEVPTLDSDVPPLPQINVTNIVDPSEPILQITASEQKIMDILETLKDWCQEEEQPKKIISDKCSDACERHKDCAAYTEDVTAADLADAYNACLEECPTWPKEMIKCINAIDIKNPNDCVSFVQCQLPQFYQEKYGQ